MRVALLFVTATLLLSAPISSGTVTPETAHEGSCIDNEDGELSGVASTDDGLRYGITVDPSDDTVSISVKNPTSETLKATPEITVDHYYVTYNYTKSLESGECWQKTVDIIRGIDITKDEHYAVLVDEGAVKNITFKKSIDARNTSQYPKPQIIDIKVVNKSRETRTGLKKYSALNITVKSKSKVAYAMYIVGHTRKTSDYTTGSVYIGQTEHTHTLPLNEDQGEVIEGELRLVPEHTENNDSIRDQVWFRGKAGEDVTIRNETYKPVAGLWRTNHYEYGKEPNEDVLDGVDRSNWFDATAVVAGAVLGTVLLLSLFYRIR